MIVREHHLYGHLCLQGNEYVSGSSSVRVFCSIGVSSAELGKRGPQYSAEYFTENTGFVNPAVSHADFRCSTYSIPKLRSDFQCVLVGLDTMRRPRLNLGGTATTSPSAGEKPTPFG